MDTKATLPIAKGCPKRIRGYGLPCSLEVEDKWFDKLTCAKLVDIVID
jgi:hypothetical protein